MTVYALLKALHIICAVIWVGGMFFAYVILRPSLGVLEPPNRLALHTQVFRRFFLIVWHAMPVIILSGFIMLFGYMGGMAGAGWTIHAMLTLGIIMAIVFVMIFFGPYRQFRTTEDRALKVAALDTIRKLIGLNLIIGLVTVAIAGLR